MVSAGSVAPSWSESPLRADWGQIPLDFSNTADWHEREVPVESLTSYDKLVDWSTEAGILGGEDARKLRELASERAEEAEAVRLRAIELREAIYRIISAAISGVPAAEDDLDLLNRVESVALKRLRLRQSPEGLGWEWMDADAELDGMLAPVAHAAALLLTSPDLERVRKCAGDPCGWLFVDTSRNQTRRWCDMKGCGNRAKARRHYAKKKME